jgi:membrane protease YdiL (CAAX protease family)
MFGGNRSAELKKVLITVAILIVTTNGFTSFLLWNLLRQIESRKSLLVLRGTSYEMLPLVFVFLELLIVIWAFRSLGPLLRLESLDGVRNQSILKMTLAGFCSGSGLLLLFVPLLLRSKPNGGLVTLRLYQPNLLGLVAFCLVAIALPVVGEIAFKGIILKTLAEDMSHPWSLLVTSLAFMLIWPVFHGFWLALGLGVVTCLLYFRYRFVVPSIVANVTFTIGVFGFLALRVLLHL